MDKIRDEQRSWLRQVLAETGLTATGLASRAGLAQTTLTKFLNDPDYPHALSSRTIDALTRATRLKFGAGPVAGGLAEPEAAKYLAKSEADPLAQAVASLTRGANAIDPWTLQSRALEAAGYLPGDVLLVDLSLEAKPGDIVCAQLYEWGRFTAETVFRAFEPPYLVTRSFDRALPFLQAVDNKNVAIKGVVVASLRPRQARAA